MRSALACSCLMLGIAGCAVPELHRDQDRLRTTLLDLYTDQILDNLVRAVNGLPIIQLDYSNANANVTVQETAGIGDGLNTTHANELALAVAKTATLTRAMVNTVTGSGNLANTNLIAITANPVLTSDAVYDAYLAFLTIPGSLVVTCTPPPHGAAHLCRKCGKEYYWVPVEMRERFFDLASITTGQRDRVLLEPEPFYARTIIRVEPEQKRSGGRRSMEVELDEAVPNADGDAALPDGMFFTFSRYLGSPPSPVRYYQTKRLVLFVEALPAGMQSLNELGERLPLAVRINIPTVPPPPLTTRQLLDRVPFRSPQVSAPASKVP